MEKIIFVCAATIVFFGLACEVNRVPKNSGKLPKCAAIEVTDEVLESARKTVFCAAGYRSNFRKN